MMGEWCNNGIPADMNISCCLFFFTDLSIKMSMNSEQFDCKMTLFLAFIYQSMQIFIKVIAVIHVYPSYLQTLTPKILGQWTGYNLINLSLFKSQFYVITSIFSANCWIAINFNSCMWHHLNLYDTSSNK